MGLNKQDFGRILIGISKGADELRRIRREDEKEAERIALEEKRYQRNLADRREDIRDQRDFRMDLRRMDLEAERIEKEKQRRANLKAADIESRRRAGVVDAARLKEQREKLEDPNHLALLYSQGRYTPQTAKERSLLDGILRTKTGNQGGDDKGKVMTDAEFYTFWMTKNGQFPRNQQKDFKKALEEYRKHVGEPATDQSTGQGNDGADMFKGIGTATEFPVSAGGAPLTGGQEAFQVPQTGNAGLDYYNYQVTSPRPGIQSRIRSQSLPPQQMSESQMLTSDGRPMYDGHGGRDGDETIEIGPLVDPNILTESEQEADSLLTRWSSGQPLSDQDMALLFQFLQENYDWQPPDVMN
jgi:hypothetical protein